ncbi:RHS repeat-associated core domain-containing protein [Chitinivorax sp. B]|uniref:RHS repeat domain-containing protein n=1 Tax=Chitinivorax sp. B TaxID=2502235 RepID=UPI0010F7F895|nr:RHS repeat-associated core domain-containing protein [Chitinivorax sp. B]
MSDPASNRLLKQSGSNAKSYILDASGNQTSDGAITLSYDNAGRLRNATKNGQSVSSFFYNAQGQLALKTANSKPIQFVYDEAGHLLAEHADPATQSPTQDHLWLGDTPIAVVRPNSSDPSKPLIYHVYADHLNTPRAIYDAFNKRLTWRWESEAFGNTLPDQDADKNGSQFVYNLRFPGQYWDHGIKLSHNWYRTYNPETGRYIQSDPIGLGGGLNTYGYVQASPIDLIDVNGLQTTVAPPLGNLFPRPMRPLPPVKSTPFPASANPAGSGLLPNLIPTIGPALMRCGAVLSMILIPSNIGQCKNPCKCGDLCDTQNSTGNTNPYTGPVGQPVVAVDANGNAIPVDTGEQIGRDRTFIWHGS